MTSLLEGARRLITRGSDLGGRIDALQSAAEAARGPARRRRWSTRPQEVVERAAGRLRLSADHTVVAIAGATGSGKSSTFNQLTGLELSAVGVRRPTTSWATACVWGSDGAQELLEWLGIPPRHQTTRDSMLDTSGLLTGRREDREMEGVVLLDLPDHDSTEVSHHLEVDRIVKLADLLVWVLDPQKYADAAIHDRYLAPLASHAGVMLVVLNHIDTVPAERRDLDARGRPAAARPGRAARGPGDRHQRPPGRGHPGAARRDRPPGGGQEGRPGSASRQTCAPWPPGSTRSAAPASRARWRPAASQAMEEALADSAGRADRGRRRSSGPPGCAPAGPPAGRSSRGSRGSGPTRCAGCTSISAPRASTSPAGPRTSIPEATPVQRAKVDTEVRALADDVSAGMTRPWADAVRRASVSRVGDMADRLDAEIAGTDLGRRQAPGLGGRRAGAAVAVDPGRARRRCLDRRARRLGLAGRRLGAGLRWHRPADHAAGRRRGRRHPAGAAVPRPGRPHGAQTGRRGGPASSAPPCTRSPGAGGERRSSASSMPSGPCATAWTPRSASSVSSARSRGRARSPPPRA